MYVGVVRQNRRIVRQSQCRLNLGRQALIHHPCAAAAIIRHPNYDVAVISQAYRMPVPLLAQGFYEGFSTIPYFEQILSVVLRVAPWAVLIYLLKWYFGGAVNRSERNMHSKVVMMTVCTIVLF